MLSKQRGSTTTVGSKNIIELNGKRYDALTGRIVVSDKNKPAVSKAIRAFNLTPGVSMDGFRKKPLANSVHLTAAEHSKTLMRKTVKKPQAIVKDKPVKRSQTIDIPSTAKLDIAFKTKANPERQVRASQAFKSKLVSKFSSAEPRVLGKPVVTAMPVVSEVVTSSDVSPPESFHNALDRATSHQQPQIKRLSINKRVAKKFHVSPRVLSIASASLAMLLVGGFIAYHNIPNVALKVASTRSGIHASLPSYQPAGFAFTGPIHYKPGQVLVNFKSNSDNERKYSVTQSSSAWNSETLLENFVTTRNQPFQTYQAGGKTIYIYNGTNATWVDGGIWYKVEGNSSLSNEQLLRLASSI